MKRFLFLLPLALAGCYLFPSRTLPPPIEEVVERVVGDNEGLVGEFFRADSDGRLALAKDDGVATALLVVADLPVYSAWEAMVGVAKALAERGDMAGAEAALEVMLEGVLGSGLKVRCQQGQDIPRCRWAASEPNFFSELEALAGIAETAAALGFVSLAARAQAAMPPAAEDEEGSPAAPPEREPYRGELVVPSLEPLAALLGPAERLAAEGDAAAGANLAREALPAIRELTESGVRGMGLVGVAKLVSLAGEAEEALGLAEDAWQERGWPGGAESGWDWEIGFAVAMLNRDHGEFREAERLVIAAVDRHKSPPRVGPMGSSGSSRYGDTRRDQLDAVKDLAAAGWHRHAVFLAGETDILQHRQVGLALAALAISSDQGLKEAEKRALYVFLLRDYLVGLAVTPDERWLAGAAKDPLAGGMYAASAIDDSEIRHEAFAYLLEAALSVGRDDILTAAVAELESLEVVLGPGMWKDYDLAHLSIRLSGRPQEVALQGLEGKVAVARSEWRLHYRIDGLWEVAEKFAAGGFLERARELRQETAELAQNDTTRARDGLLYRVVRNFAGIGEGIRAHSLADQIQGNEWRARADIPLALQVAAEGDWKEVWRLLPTLSNPMLGMELLEGAAPILLAAGETPETRVALARMEEAVAELEESAHMSFEARRDLARANLAAGRRAEATAHYRATEEESPDSGYYTDYYQATRLAYDLADLAADLGLSEEEADFHHERVASCPLSETSSSRPIPRWLGACGSRRWRQLCRLAPANFGGTGCSGCWRTSAPKLGRTRS